MVGYWRRFLLTETKLRSIKALKRTRPIFGHLHGIILVYKGFIRWSKRGIFFLRDKRGKSRAHLACSGSQSESRIRFLLPALRLYRTIKKGTAFFKNNLPMFMTPRLCQQLTTLQNTITYDNTLCLSPQNFVKALSSVSPGSLNGPKRN